MLKSQIQKVKDLLQPELDKRIICNKLEYNETTNHTSKDGKYKYKMMWFKAYNNELNEHQIVTYQPETGLLNIVINHSHIFPEN